MGLAHLTEDDLPSKHNLNATAAPNPAVDDVTLGYLVGSRWIDTTNDKEYVCVDNTDGAAVWAETTQAGGGGGTNLGYTPSAINGTVTSDTGTDATLPLATPTGGSNEAGLLAPADKDKLDNLSGTNTGDEVSASTTVQGIAELATQTEVNTGTDTTRIVTPDTLEDKTYGVFTGSTISDNVTLKTALQELETAVEGGGFAPLRNGYAVGAAQTTSTSYSTVARFGFDGTTVLGTPTEIKALIEMNGPTSIDIRFYDVTNSLVIASKTGNVVGTPTIVDMGTLSNLPSGAAIIEIQLKRNGGTGSSSATINSYKIA